MVESYMVRLGENFLVEFTISFKDTFNVNMTVVQFNQRR
jgi:hypothetical protein